MTEGTAAVPRDAGVPLLVVPQITDSTTAPSLPNCGSLRDTYKAPVSGSQEFFVFFPGRLFGIVYDVSKTISTSIAKNEILVGTDNRTKQSLAVR